MDIENGKMHNVKRSMDFSIHEYEHVVYGIRYIDSSWKKTINQTVIELYGKLIAGEK